MSEVVVDYPELVNEAKAAEFLGIKRQTLSVWRSTGRYDLPFVRVGRCVRYRLADLQHFLDTRTVRPEAATE